MSNFDIVYASDDKFYKMLKCSIYSVMRNNQHNIIFHILSGGITEDHKKDLICQVQNFENQIFFYEIKESTLSSLEKLRITKEWPIAAMARLHIEKLLPINLDKILYLDCDTIVVGSIKKLFSDDYSSKPVYGVLDCMDSKYRTKIGIGTDGLYINSGVLIMNLKYLRNAKSSEKIDKIITTMSSKFKYPDQDVINVSFLKNIGVLPLKYNVISQILLFTRNQYATYRNSNDYYDEIEFNAAKENPVILHFTSGFAFARPWYKESQHPYAEIFRKYYINANSIMDFWGNDNRTKMQIKTAYMFNKMPNIMLFLLKIMRRINNR